MAAFTAAEAMAVFIARQIQDGETVAAGTNLAVPRAGILLAHFTRCPNLRLQLGGQEFNLSGSGDAPAFEFRGDFDRLSGPAGECVVPLDFETLSQVDLTFVGGLQIDRYGNTNLIGIPREPGRPEAGFKLRGPGTTGIASLTTYVRRVFIYTRTHTPRVFVERCSLRSSVGWDAGGADARIRLGLPGAGPELVITPLGVMDFHEQTKAMRLRYLAPGVSAARVREETGFPLEHHPDLQELPGPTPEELTVLRERVDPAGVLRRED